MRRHLMACALGLGMLVSSLPAAATAAVPVPGAGHVAWTDVDNSFSTEAVTFDVDGDGDEDTIVGAGDRIPYYLGSVPGPPHWAVHQGHDFANPPLPKIRALDATTGRALWSVSLVETGDASLRPTRTEKRLLEDLHVGDVDGDGDTDLLVLSSGYPLDATKSPRQITTVYDPRTGRRVWEEVVQRTEPANHILVRAFVPLSAGGRSYGVISQLHAPQDGTFNADVQVVAGVADAPFQPVTKLAVEDGITEAMVHYFDGVPRIFLFNDFRRRERDDDSRLRVRAVDVNAHAAGLTFTPRWTQKSLAGSSPGFLGIRAFVIDGDKPLLVTGENALMARDANTGEPLWRSEAAWLVNGFGDYVLHDVNADGVKDIVVASAGNAVGPPVPVLISHPMVTAVNGKDGKMLWRRADLRGEMTMVAMTKGDIDGDGAVEVVTSMFHPDGFPYNTSGTDDPGMIGVYDITTGAPKCRFSLERMVGGLDTGQMDSTPGVEIVATTLGGTTYAFRAAQPGCGVLATAP